jgi:transposase
MRMCELLVGLPKVSVLGIFGRSGQPLFIHIESRCDAPVGCPSCGVIARVKDRPAVELADLPSFGRSARIVWHKVRWCCADPDCPVGSWTEENRRIAAPRMAMTDRAGRWVTEQVGRCARSVAEVAKELGCDWHTVNNAVVSYGAALVDEPGRYASVVALGLDEVLFVRRGQFHRQEFSTSICDVMAGQLLDIVPGRGAQKPSEWLEKKSEAWRKKVRYGTLDLSGRRFQPVSATSSANFSDGFMYPSVLRGRPLRLR